MTPQEWLALVHCPTNTKYSARELLAIAERIIKELVMSNDLIKRIAGLRAKGKDNG